MNKYLLLFHHHWSSDEGVMTIVIRAASKESAIQYVEAQFRHMNVWNLQSIQQIGIDAYA